jgi:hypothetical protein
VSEFDTKVFTGGAQLAAFHIEAGQRNFMEVCRIIAKELDSDLFTLRPYLRAWFNGARDVLEDFGIDVSGASMTEEVAAAMGCFAMWAGKPPATDQGIEALVPREQPQPSEFGVANG